MYQNKNILVMIPARAGSKGIKNKNLQIVGTESIITRSIRHAQQSQYADIIAVSTNGQDIKEEALQHGAQVIDRPDDLSTSTSPTEEAMIHAVQTIKCDYCLILQPTSPFRSPGLIDRCISKIIDEGADSLVTGWKFHDFCFYKEIETGEWLSTFDYVHRPMRQAIPLKGFKFFDCGNVYITRTEFLLKEKCRLGGKIVVEPVSSLECVQIDDYDDLELCHRIASGKVN